MIMCRPQFKHHIISYSSVKDTTIFRLRITFSEGKMIMFQETETSQYATEYRLTSSGRTLLMMI